MLDKLMNGLRLSQEEDDDDDYADTEYERSSRESVLPYEGRKQNNESSREFRSSSAMGNPNIIITKPRKLNDAKDIIDKLADGNTVAVDLEHTADNEKQRIMDMLAGYCYCTQSNIESINTNIYIISHTGIELEEENQ